MALAVILRALEDNWLTAVRHAAERRYILDVDMRHGLGLAVAGLQVPLRLPSSRSPRNLYMASGKAAVFVDVVVLIVDSAHTCMPLVAWSSLYGPCSRPFWLFHWRLGLFY
jgi:hypothetical protein